MVLLATTVLAVVTRPWTWSITLRPVGTPAVAFAGSRSGRIYAVQLPLP